MLWFHKKVIDEIEVYQYDDGWIVSGILCYDDEDDFAQEAEKQVVQKFTQLI